MDPCVQPPLSHDHRMISTASNMTITCSQLQVTCVHLVPSTDTGKILKVVMGTESGPEIASVIAEEISVSTTSTYG